LDQISPPPSLSGNDRACYVTGIGKVDDNIVLLLDLHLMISDQDLSSVARIEEINCAG
jgi:chemotaxis signal transduction protein